jgi:hypothetical protein
MFSVFCVCSVRCKFCIVGVCSPREIAAVQCNAHSSSVLTKRALVRSVSSVCSESTSDSHHRGCALSSTSDATSDATAATRSRKQIIDCRVSAPEQELSGTQPNTHAG